MKTRSLLALTVGCALVAGCAGLKDAFTAHVNVVATAGSQELSVTRLGTLLGHAPSEIPATREVANVVAGFWVDYQLLAAAAADGDSLTNQKEIDEATSQYTDNMLLQHMEQHIDSSFPPVQPTEQTYNSALGELYAARHILFRFPLAATQAQKDSVHRVAAKILPQVNNANFAAMAKKYSGDDVSAAKGGDVGIFARDGMVAEFGDAVAALKPGQISSLVASQYGYHIIQRLPYSQVKDEYDKRFTQFAATVGEREYLSRLESAANIQVKAGAASVAKVAALDPQGRRADQTVLATYNGGQLTVARFLHWLPQGTQIPQQMQTAPDSLITTYLKNLSVNDLLLAKADSAGIKITPEQQQTLYAQFRQAVTASWNALGVDPKALADSAGTQAERERLAAAHVESLMDALMTGAAQPVPVPAPLKTLLEAKYHWKINDAGLDRAADMAKQLRASSDSAAAATLPPSQVPIPGAATPPATTTGKSGGSSK